MLANAIFSGGGVKGLAFVGAIEVCEERGYRWNQLAGTSCGSIIAALLAAGFTAKELKLALKTLDYKKIIAPTIWSRLPGGIVLRLFLKNGLYSGKYIEQWMDTQLATKGISTFDHLPKGKLTIIASDLSTGQILSFPQDAHQFKHHSKTLKISTAIRMSTSIPFFFDPVIWKKENKHKHYIVDGGVLSNFPVWLFDTDELPSIPSFGFNLRSKNPDNYYKIKGPFSMLYALISVMVENQDAKYIENQDAVRTIFIPTDGIKATDFQISKKDQDKLYHFGKDAANQFFSTWNFENYKKYYFIKRSQRIF